MLDQAAIYGRVRTAIRAAGNQKLFAEACGISQAYLSDMLNGKRALSDAVLRAAGIRRVVTYVDCEPTAGAERVGSEPERRKVGVVAASVPGVGVCEGVAWPAHLPPPTFQYVRVTVSKGDDNA